MRRTRKLFLGALFAGAAALGARPAAAVEPQTGPIRWEDTGPPQGVHFYWYEPSFYTGFAPRCQEKDRIHLRLGRGNQLRVTVVLGPQQIDAYLEDLRTKRLMFQELIDQKRIELTTNLEYEKFVRRFDEMGIESLVQRKPSFSAEQWRAKSLEILQALNPGRVFHIRRPLDALFKSWRDRLMTTAPAAFDDLAVKLDVINELLPGRLELYKLPPELDAALPPVLELARAADRDPAAGNPAYHEAAQAFLELAARGLYPVVDGAVDAWEFTAIYPAGTAQEFVNYKGKKLPHFGVTGVWPLIKRVGGRGAVGMVDYLSTNPAYGFITMLPYEKAGGIVYNAFHNAGVRCPLGGTSFFPKSWNKAPGTRNPKRNFQTLWICSRGPVSHGCTRLGSGHMSELRHIVPSASEDIEGLPTFRNLPHTYDVFDINGDGTPEVMGVKYYLAFSTTQDRLPHKAWAPNKREPFYAWLYAGELAYRPDGTGTFAEVVACRFLGRRAEPGRTYKDILLYEAEWEPEAIQFYRLVPTAFDGAKGFEFNRELRRVGVGYAASLKKLFLQR